jgi:hypothetical protein
MRHIICRLLLVTVLALSMQAIPVAPARADILDDLANLIDDVGSPSWLPASGDDIRNSKAFIVCLSNAGNDVEVLRCIEDFKDTPLGSKIGNEIPSWVYDLITVYIALKEKDYTTLVVYLGKAAACAILQVISGGAMDVCGLIEELVEAAKALLDAATAVYEFFKDASEAAWEAAKDAACDIAGWGCDESSPPEQVAYAWIFAPKVTPEGLAAIKDIDAGIFPALRKKLEDNARAKPPISGNPSLDSWFKTTGYSFPHSAVDVASKAYQKAVEAQWKADLAKNVLPVLGQSRADYGTPAKVSALAGPALNNAAPDGSKFRSLVTDQCVQDLNIGMGFAHVDRWVAANSMDAMTQFHLKSNRQWCGSDFWSPEVKSEFAKHLRNHVKNEICPMSGQVFSCQSTETFDACRKLLTAVGIEEECAVDRAKVGLEIAQKIVAELKSRGSKTNYVINEAPPLSVKPVEIVCVRPTQRFACDDIYASKYDRITPKVIDCGLQMSAAYEAVMTATAAEADRLSSKYGFPFAVDGRDPLFVHAPSTDLQNMVQEDPQQQFAFDFYAIKVPRSVDGLDKPGMGMDKDLTEPVAQMGRNSIEEKVRGFHAGGPFDPMDENPLENVASPVEGVQDVGLQSVKPETVGAAAASRQIAASKPGAVAATPAGQKVMSLPGQTGAGAPQPMSGSLPPGSAPVQPPAPATQIRTAAPQVMQAQGAAMPDIAADGQVSVGGVRAPWGHSLSVNAARAQSAANGLCFFPVKYAVRNVGAKPSGAFHSAWKSSLGPPPREKGWPSLAPGDVMQQTETIGLKPGQNVLTLTLDSRGQVVEANESGNTVRITVILGGECGAAKAAPKVKPGAPAVMQPQQTLPQRMQLPSAPVKRTQ